MSLILEALRKSEAERRRGQAPTLHGELPALPARNAHRASPWPWLLVALVSLLAVWLAWRNLAMTSSEAVPSTAIASPPLAPADNSDTTAAPEPPPTQPQPRLKVDTAITPLETSSSKPVAAATHTATAPSATPDIASPPSDTLLALGDLDGTLRAALPPLKLSMHVWNNEPTQRFVILDGQRLGEGSRLGEAHIESITREGLILAWRNQRISIRRP